MGRGWTFRDSPHTLVSEVNNVPSLFQGYHRLWLDCWDNAPCAEKQTSLHTAPKCWAWLSQLLKEKPCQFPSGVSPNLDSGNLTKSPGNDDELYVVTNLTNPFSLVQRYDVSCTSKQHYPNTTRSWAPVVRDASGSFPQLLKGRVSLVLRSKPQICNLLEKQQGYLLGSDKSADLNGPDPDVWSYSPGSTDIQSLGN